MAVQNMEDDSDLIRAIELSRETYLEEENRRKLNDSPDLLGDDLEKITREKNIQEIEQLFNDKQSVVDPYSQPGSTATLPYGFTPPFAVNRNFLTNLCIPPQTSSLPSTSVSTPVIQTPPALLPRKNTDLNCWINNNNNKDDVSSSTVKSPSVNEVVNPKVSNNETNRMSIDFDAILSTIKPVEENVAPPVPPRHHRSNVNSNSKIILNICPYQNCYVKECESFKNKIQSLIEDESELFYTASAVDYRVVIADSIKFAIYRAHPLPEFFNTLSNRIVMTYESSNTCGDLLIAVLNKFATSEDIWECIKIDDFVLKIYGTDEFLENDTILGNLPYIVKCLSRGEDVLLQLTQKCLNKVKFEYNSDFFEKPISMKFQLFSDGLKRFLNPILTLLDQIDQTNDFSFAKRQDVIDRVNNLCSFCFNVKTNKLRSAIHAYLAADVDSHYKHTKKELLESIYTYITMICSSTNIDVSLAPIYDKNTQVKQSNEIQDELIVCIESLHNLSQLFQDKYSEIFVNVRLLDGARNLGRESSTHKKLLKFENGHISVVFLELFHLEKIMIIPKSTIISIQVFGILKLPINDVTKELIGYTFLPLYNNDGFLHQGIAALPLYRTLQSNNMIEPWGPRPLIRSESAEIIVISTLEYEYDIEFPKVIEHEHVVEEPFDALNESDRLRIIKIMDKYISGNNLSNNDKLLIWSNRKTLMNIPEAFCLVLESALNWDCLCLSNIYPLLKKWTLPLPQAALQLLLPLFQNTEVRRKAVEIMKAASSEFLINLLPQLVEVLRFETTEDSDLAVFLIERCKKDRRFATLTVWELDQRVMNEDSSYSIRCCFLRDFILELGITNFAEDISCQKSFLSLLDHVCYAAKKAENILAANRLIQRELTDISEKIERTHLRLPINPGFMCTAINIEECSVFNSLTRPLKLSMIGELGNYNVIYKVGDDLRQDAVVLQMVKVMNDIWLRNNLDLRVITYRVLPTGKNRGLIELVENCLPLRDIQTKDNVLDVYKNDTVLNYISRENPSEFDYRTASDNFIRSCAAWSVATYVLGIGDRHNDNIMITTSGHIFHIDFGKYMGDLQTALGVSRDRVPFVLTPEIVVAIDGGSSFTTQRFQDFVDYCCKAYNILRQNSSLLLNIIRCMSCSAIPNMNLKSINFIKKTLMLELTEDDTFLSDAEATTRFTELIRESINSKIPRVNFLAHTVAQRISNNALNKSNNRFEFSFTKETHNMIEDGEISRIVVSRYEKWRNPNKVYMFVFDVYRVKEKLPQKVYRSFDEVIELYNGLKRRFSAGSLPLFSSSGGLRSNNESTAKSRQGILQIFFDRLLSLKCEVSTCDLIYTFFHTIHRDTNPEIIKDTRNVYASSDELPKINITLTIEKDSHILKVFIQHARNLPLVGFNNSQPDSYVKTYLLPDKMMDTKRKSPVIKSTCHPTYNINVEYLFDSEDDLMGSRLEVAIWNSNNNIFNEKMKICSTSIPVSIVLKNPLDVRGAKRYSDWFTLSISC